MRDPGDRDVSCSVEPTVTPRSPGSRVSTPLRVVPRDDGEESVSARKRLETEGRGGERS